MDAAWLLVIYKFLSSFRLFGPIAVLFFRDWIGVGYPGVFIAQLAFMAGTFLFEIPTGWVADRFGRKASVLAGTFLIGILTLAFLSRSFPVIVIAEFLLGFAGTLVSGADKALLYDIAKRGTRKWLARMNSASTIGMVAAHLAGPMLVYVFGSPEYLPASFVIAGLVIFLSGFLLLPLPNHRGEVGNPLDEGIKGMGELLSRFSRESVSWSLFMPATFLIYWLYQSFLPDAGLPVGLLGIVSAGFNLLSAVGSHVSLGMALPSLLTGALYFLLPAGGLVPRMAAVFGIAFLRASKMTAIEDAVARRCSKNRRATILSAMSLMESASRSVLYIIASISAGVSEHLVPVMAGAILLALGAFEMSQPKRRRH